MDTFLLLLAILINSSSAGRECKAIYATTPYDDIALFPLDICLMFHWHGIDYSSALTCNATGHKVLRKWNTSTICEGIYEDESYDVGDSVECTGIDCPYAVLKRYNSYQCTPENEDYVPLPVLIGDCVQVGLNAWVQYECTSTVIKTVQYNNNRCEANGNDMGTDGTVFRDGTCENHGYQYDEIPYCATAPTMQPSDSPTTAAPTPATLSPTLTTETPTFGPTMPSTSPTTSAPSAPSVSPTQMPSSNTVSPTGSTGAPTDAPSVIIVDGNTSTNLAVIFSTLFNCCVVISMVAMV